MAEEKLVKMIVEYQLTPKRGVEEQVFHTTYDQYRRAIEWWGETTEGVISNV
ncbi:MAG: hypothetical protein Tsb0021_18500 [Chlamydiales bacterium]